MIIGIFVIFFWGWGNIKYKEAEKKLGSQTTIYSHGIGETAGDHDYLRYCLPVKIYPDTQALLISKL